jgi:type I restriction enzyme S subunit
MSPLNIPESWAETRLEVAGSWGSGGTPLKSKKEFYGGNINWLKTGDLNNGIITEVPDKITKLGLDDIGGRLYPPQTVVMAMYGATIGKLGILDIEVATNQACACCTTHKDIYYKYLFYWLMNYRKEYIALGQGGAQPNISRSMIYEQPFAIPPRPEQERIVQKVESCFEKIDATAANLNKIKTLLEKYRESLLAKAFRGELVPQDPNDEPARVLIEKIRKERTQNAKGKKAIQEFLTVPEDEQPYSLPEGWIWVRLDDVLKKITDGTHHSPPNTSSGDFKYVTAKNVRDWGLDLSNITYVSKKIHDEIYSRCDPQFGDVFLIKDGATSGISCINTLDEPFSMLSSVALLRTYEFAVHNEYLLLYLKSPLFQEIVADGMAGAAIKRITLNKIESMLLPLPPLKEQKKIVSLIKEKLSTSSIILETVHKKADLLKLQKESILQRAFEGQLVEQIPSEGTGHELLARITSEIESYKKSGSMTKTKKKAPAKKTVAVKGKKNGKK